MQWKKGATEAKKKTPEGVFLLGTVIYFTVT